MTISGDYSTPVYVNGFQCKNCTDVDNAKKNIDPAHPKAGPFGVDAAQDPSANQTNAAVKFGGQLSKLTPASSSSQSSSDSSGSDPGSGTAPPPKSSTPGLGALLDLSV